MHLSVGKYIPRIGVCKLQNLGVSHNLILVTCSVNFFKDSSFVIGLATNSFEVIHWL